MDGDPNEKYVILQNIGMSLLRDFFKSSSLYFLGNVLTKLIGFLMLPIFTEYLNTNEYGYYDVLCALSTIRRKRKQPIDPYLTVF